MKKYFIVFLLALAACGLFGNQQTNHESEKRIVCLSK